MKDILTALVMALAPLPLAAQGLESGLKSARVLPGWRSESGAHIAALELDLSEGWKTYWRSPGETGFPPQFDWQSSENVGRVEILWPAPQRFDQDGVSTIGYAGRVILPLRIHPQKAGQDIALKSHINLGICKDVCVPMQLDMDQTLPATGGARSGLIAGALSDRPMTATEAGVEDVTCALEQPSNGLALTARVKMPRRWALETMVIEPSDPSLYVEQNETVRDGNVLTSRVSITSATGSPVMLQRKDLRITVIGDTGAVEMIGCKAQG